MSFVSYFSFYFFIFFSIFCINDIRSIRSTVTKYYLFLVFIFVCLIYIGFRGFVFTDWINYYPRFERCPANISDFIYYVQNNKFLTDLGFEVFQFICKLISPSFFTFQFICFTIDFFILYLVFKDLNKDNIILCFLCFFAFKGFEIEFNLLRNSKSIMLFLFSLRYVYGKKSFTKYCLMNIIGCLFHISSLIYIPMFFLLGKKFNRLFYICIFIFSILIMLSRISISKKVIELICSFIPEGKILQKLLTYSQSEVYSASSVFSAIILERILIFILILYMYPYLKLDKKNFIFINMYALYFIVCFVFWDFYVIVQRGSFLFIGSIWILVPRMFSYIKNKSYKMLFYILFFGYALYKLYNDCSNPWFEYQFCLFDLDYDSKLIKVKNFN